MLKDTLICFVFFVSVTLVDVMLKDTHVFGFCCCVCVEEEEEEWGQFTNTVFYSHSLTSDKCHPGWC